MSNHSQLESSDDKICNKNSSDTNCGMAGVVHEMVDQGRFRPRENRSHGSPGNDSGELTFSNIFADTSAQSNNRAEQSAGGGGHERHGKHEHHGREEHHGHHGQRHHHGHHSQDSSSDNTNVVDNQTDTSTTPGLQTDFSPQTQPSDQTAVLPSQSSDTTQTTDQSSVLPAPSSDTTQTTDQSSVLPTPSSDTTQTTDQPAILPAPTADATQTTDQTAQPTDGQTDHAPGKLVGLSKMPVGEIVENVARVADNPPNLKASDMIALRNDRGIGGVQNIYDLPNDRLLNQSELDYISRDYAAAREAGMPMITRFRYADDAGQPDAPADMILAQMKQLAPVMKANEDVIGVMDMGFVGAWGEWNRSTNNPLNDKDFDLQKKMYDIYSEAIPNTPIAFSHADTLREMFGDNNIPNNVMLFNDSIGKQNGTDSSQNNDSGEFYQPGDYEWAQKNHIMFSGENQQVGSPELVLQRIHELNITSMNLWGDVRTQIEDGGYFPEVIAAMKANAQQDGIPV